MKFTKKVKRILAMAVTIALVLTQVSFNTTSLKADDAGYEVQQIADKDLGQGFSYDDSTSVTVVNIQQPVWAEEQGIYMNVPAGISKVSVNGIEEGGFKIDGAGVVVYLTALTKKVNTVVITYAGGEGTVTIKNANGTGDGGEEPTSDGEGPEEPSSSETTTSEQDEWKDVGEGYFYNTSTKATIVNIQQPGWASEQGIYMNVPGGISKVTVNGVEEGVCAIDGAGVVVYLTALTEEINTIVITYAAGEETVIIKNTNSKDPDAGETTTPSNPEETTPSEDGYSTEPGAVWSIESRGSAAAQHKNADVLDDYYVKVTAGQNAGSGDVVYTESKTSITGVKAGYIYDYVININASEGAYIGTGVSDATMLVTTIDAGDNAVMGSFKATDSTMTMILGFGHTACAGKTFHITGVKIKEHVPTDNPVEGRVWTAWTSTNMNFREISESYETYTITDSIGKEWWHIQTQIDNVLFEAGKSYECKFTIKASKAGKEFRFDNRIGGDPKLSTAEGMKEEIGEWYQIPGDTDHWYCDFTGFYPASDEHEFKNIRISLGYGNDAAKTQSGKTETAYAQDETDTFELVNFSLLAKAAEDTDTHDKLSVEGFQMTIGNITDNEGRTFNGGIRTVYTVPDEIDGKNVSSYERGLIYALKSEIGDADSEVVLNSKSSYVVSAPATSRGVIDEQYGTEDVKMYAMIMATDITSLPKSAIDKEIYVRAYIKAGNMYYYSAVKTYSIYNIADTLYQNSYMQTEAGHNALYDNFLVKSNSNYAKVPYAHTKDWLYLGDDLADEI